MTLAQWKRSMLPVESGEIPKSLDVAVLLVPGLQKEVLETKAIKSPEGD